MASKRSIIVFKRLGLPVLGVFLLVSSSLCRRVHSPLESVEAPLAKIASTHYALVNGTIIDGTGGAPIENGVIVVKGDVITAVGARAQVSIPADAQMINVQGSAVLPGIINAHVHYAYDESRLKNWAYNGVTTVRDEGILASLNLSQALTIRNNARKKPECARLVSGGFIISVPGGYGGMAVTSPMNARQRVLDVLDQGVDIIKISQEDGYNGKSNLPKLDSEEMSAIITTAHERGTLVSAHITQSLYWEMVAQAGVDDVAHIAYDTAPERVLDAMISKKIVIVPTFTVFRNYNAPVNVCIDNLRRLVQKGGTVALGNDYGGGPGEFEDGIPYYELYCMAAAGMSPMQIIIASTRNAARACHIESVTGTLELGKCADMIVVKENPLDDLRRLKNIRLVIHNGVNIRAES